MTKDQLLSLRKKPEPVPAVPGLFVRVLSGVETFAWHEDGRKDTGDLLSIAASLVARAACDGHGNRLFSDSDEDRAAVRGMDWPTLEAIQTVAARVNGFGDAGREDVRKNSESPASASSSSSPGTSGEPSAS